MFNCCSKTSGPQAAALQVVSEVEIKTGYLQLPEFKL